MSTRGVIARKNENGGFTGHYHHWDSYPSGLGATLYEWAQRMPVECILQILLDEHPAGWSSIVDSDPTMEPGYVDLCSNERRCVICGMKNWEHYEQYYRSKGLPLPDWANPSRDSALLTDHQPEHETLPTDNRPKCFCHGERHEDIDEVVTEKNAAEMGCEYAYVFHHDDGVWFMDILSSYTPQGEKMIGMFGLGDPEARWHLIASIRLDGPEPDWKELCPVARSLNAS